MMRILFILFIFFIIMYILKGDLFGPRIQLEREKTLDFALHSKKPNWNEYFTVNDGHDGKIASENITYYDEAINFDKPGTQQMSVEANDSKGNNTRKTFDVNIDRGFTSVDFERLQVNQELTNEIFINNDITAKKITGFAEQRAKIVRNNGSKALAIILPQAKKGVESSGIKAEIDGLPGTQYYLTYKVHLPQTITNAKIVLPSIKTKSKLRFQIEGSNIIVTDTNGDEHQLTNYQLSSKPFIFTIKYEIGSQADEGDRIEVYIDNKMQLSLEQQDFGVKKLTTLNLNTYISEGTSDDDYLIYLDDIKLSMIENDILVR